MKELVLIIVLLTPLSLVEPIYESKATGLKVPPDCTMSSKTNTPAPAVLKCEITPNDNGYVDNLLPSKSFCGSAVLIVENVPSVPVAKNYAFLKFNMTNNLPSEVMQSEARPENASLQMYVRLMNFFYNASVEIHNVSPENWSENTLTWNTMPPLEPSNVSLNIMQNGTWARWNIIRLVQPLSNSNGQIAFAAISSETNWRNLIWFDSDEYPPAHGTTSPTLQLTFFEPYLTIETPFSGIPVSVGGNVFRSGADGSVKLLVPWGSYAIRVPDTISIANGTRGQFVDWGDRSNSSSRILRVGNNVTLRANYGTQHEVIVSSPHGTVSGAGWYFEGAEATISVNPTAVPVEGVEGWLGARYVFDQWTGACVGTTPQCNVLMSRPQYVKVLWRIDWSETIIAAIILTTSASLFALLEKRLRRGSTKTSKTPPRRSRRVSRYRHDRTSKATTKG